MNCISKDYPGKDKVFIYSLSDPRDLNVRYVGKTVQSLYKRYCDHISLKNNREKIRSRSKNWVKSLNKIGKKPIIELIDIVDKNEWEENEIFYIEYFKYLGFDLTNHQKGGGLGNLGHNWKLSEESKNNIRQIKKDKISTKRILVDCNGSLIKKYNNILIASEDLNISYESLYNYSDTKTLIDKKFYLLKENDNISEIINKRRSRNISIKNENTDIIFRNQKECSVYLDISVSLLSMILNKKTKNNTNYKINRI